MRDLQICLSVSKSTLYMVALLMNTITTQPKFIIMMKNYNYMLT